MLPQRQDNAHPSPSHPPTHLRYSSSSAVQCCSPAIDVSRLLCRLSRRRLCSASRPDPISAMRLRPSHSSCSSARCARPVPAGRGGGRARGLWGPSGQAAGQANSDASTHRHLIWEMWHGSCMPRRPPRLARRPRTLQHAHAVAAQLQRAQGGEAVEALDGANLVAGGIQLGQPAAPQGRQRRQGAHLRGGGGGGGGAWGHACGWGEGRPKSTAATAAATAQAVSWHAGLGECCPAPRHLVIRHLQVLQRGEGSQLRQRLELVVAEVEVLQH